MQLFVDHLTVIDSAMLDAQFGVLGQSWIVDAVLTGALDEQSMVMDFGHVKKQIKHAIDDWVDHVLLVPRTHPALTDYTHHSDGVTLSWQLDDGGMIHYFSPAQAVCDMDAAIIDQHTVARYLQQRLLSITPSSVERIDITLRDEVIDGPFYHYAHGLKKHDGNCQRIAHGHRSRIMIWRDGVLADDLMQRVAREWNGIYLGSIPDIVHENNGRIAFGYTSPQGKFYLELPRNRCDLLEGDSTVECIAQHLAQQLKRAEPDASFKVRAYEGVDKGAIAES